MEENVDSIDESNIKAKSQLNKDIISSDSIKDEKGLISKDANNLKVDDETSNNLNKDSNIIKANDGTSSNLKKDANNLKVNSESSNNPNKDTNNVKVNDETSINLKKDNSKEKISDENPKAIKIKPKKEIPIEKKPFNEFINDHLLPSIVQEFKVRGFEVAEINIKNTSRPIAGDKCWVIYCEIKEICNFWLSFEKEDIASLKSISLCKSNQKPSVIESFLIDEKRITLKLIISRILQRLNGQKLIGNN